MPRFANRFAKLALTASLLTLSIGCAARFTAYDAGHGDNHRWDANENRAYHVYWTQSHPHDQFRDYRKADANEQAAYWNWRHAHPDGR